MRVLTCSGQHWSTGERSQLHHALLCAENLAISSGCKASNSTVLQGHQGIGAFVIGWFYGTRGDQGFTVTHR